MMEINNKFNIGDELYTIVRKPIKYNCPVCNGSGAFIHNGYDVRCTHCCGTGNMYVKRTLWCVADEKVKIRRINVSIWSDVVDCKYKTDYRGTDCNVKSRSEDMLFLTKEDAKQACMEMNASI